MSANNIVKRNENILQDFKSGFSLEAISEKYFLNLPTVRNLLTESGTIEKYKRLRKVVRKKKVVVPVEVKKEEVKEIKEVVEVSKKLEDYCILTSSTIRELESIVKMTLVNGYRPSGSVTKVSDYKDGKVVWFFIQAVIK